MFFQPFLTLSVLDLSSEMEMEFPERNYRANWTALEEETV